MRRTAVRGAPVTDHLTDRAALALPWYFGQGASTAAGDAGLRSSLGGQIEALRASQLEGGGGMLESRAVDSSDIEDAMHQRLEAGGRMARVAERLAGCSDAHVTVLRLAFGTAPLAFGVSGCAVLTASAAKLVGAEPQRATLNAALRAAHKASPGGSGWVRVELEAQALLGPAVRAYEGAAVGRRRHVETGWRRDGR